MSALPARLTCPAALAATLAGTLVLGQGGCGAADARLTALEQRMTSIEGQLAALRAAPPPATAPAPTPEPAAAGPAQPASADSAVPDSAAPDSAEPDSAVPDSTNVRSPFVTVEPPPPEPPPPVAPQPPPPPPKIAGPLVASKDGSLALPVPVLFEPGTERLTPESDEVLELVRRYLVQTPQVTLLRIENHTDLAGVTARNQKLSEQRAMTVAQWLTLKGIDCKRLLPVGFGEERPLIAPEATEADRAKNRRTVFVNAHIRGRAVGGLPADGGGHIAGDPCQ